jgi:hypothetical protein
MFRKGEIHCSSICQKRVVVVRREMKGTLLQTLNRMNYSSKGFDLCPLLKCSTKKDLGL